MKYLIRLKVHDFLIKSIRTELRTYKVEEPTFGSPCLFSVAGRVPICAHKT